MHFVFIIMRVYVHVWSDELRVHYVYIILRIYVWSASCSIKVRVYVCTGKRRYITFL